MSSRALGISGRGDLLAWLRFIRNCTWGLPHFIHIVHSVRNDIITSCPALQFLKYQVRLPELLRLLWPGLFGLA